VKTKIALVALAAVLGTLMSAPAATPSAGTLTASEPLLTWTGSVRGGTINPFIIVSPAPQVRCLQANTCDEFALTVALGSGYWQANGAGAVEVAIKWPYDGIIDLDLQVLNAAGKVVAKSTAVDSNSESVFIQNAADGVYTVRVIPSNTFNPGNRVPRVAYDALAQIEPFAVDPPGTGVPRLPNLIALPPDGFHVASALNLIPIPENPVISCYPEETIQNKAHPTKCLRFNQTIANVGAGPLELRFDMRGILTPTKSDDLMYQRIYNTDGSYTERLADRYVFHAVHAHIHYVGFGQSYLFHDDADTGNHTSKADAVRIGNKVGFCVGDIKFQEQYWGQTGNGPRQWAFPTCNIPKEINPGGPIWMVQGVDVGWSDVYGWNLADQYINITGVPDGDYEVVQAANPTHSVLEATYADNCSATVIHIQGKAITTLSSSASAPCPA
jgi:lysyl oxidase